MSHKTGQPSNSGAKQLRLRSEEEHERLRRSSVSPPPKGETPSYGRTGIARQIPRNVRLFRTSCRFPRERIISCE